MQRKQLIITRCEECPYFEEIMTSRCDILKRVIRELSFPADCPLPDAKEAQMSHRDECIIDTYEDAKQWLEKYSDTIIDEQALKVINILQYCTSEEWDDLQNQISCKEDQIQELTQRVSELETQVKEREMTIAYLEDKHK